jgi:hypothetical protein
LRHAPERFVLLGAVPGDTIPARLFQDSVMARGSRILACAACVMSALASAAPPQTNPAASSPLQPETVTVTARRPSPEQLTDTVIANFVDLHGAKDRKSGQFVRDLGVCPLVLGLPPAFNDFVSQRILAVAKSVDARTQTVGKCTPNIEVVFTDQPQKVLDELYQKTRGVILGVHYVHEVKTSIHVSHTIQAWYVTGTHGVGDNGTNVEGTDTATTANDTDTTRIHTDDAYTVGPTPIVTGSRLPGRLESLIVNALILVNGRDVQDKPIGPVADYIAMLALPQPKSLDDCNDLPSILDMYASGCDARPKPDSLTAGDIAYLRRSMQPI